jgi:hypothetical protein
MTKFILDAVFQSIELLFSVFIFYFQAEMNIVAFKLKLFFKENQHKKFLISFWCLIQLKIMKHLEFNNFFVLFNFKMTMNILIRQSE